MNDVSDLIVKSVTLYPTFWFGLLIGQSFLFLCYRVTMAALATQADLMGLAALVGAIGTATVGLMTVFVVRAVKAQ